MTDAERAVLASMRGGQAWVAALYVAELRKASMKCPYAERFQELVNMSPAEIRAWARDPRSREYSFAATRARLPALAKLKAKPSSAWTAKDCAFAKRVVSFNSRMSGALRRDGCTRGYAVSLRNWGHAPKRCAP